MEASSSSSSLRIGGEGKMMTFFLWGLKLFLGVVFVGWLMMWVMTPTNTFRNTWLPKLRADTDSTYFGRQGTNLLFYTFPILFISLLGCFYLHLTKGRDNVKSDRVSRRLQEWKRPALVKGPLGIVSVMELAFFLMFLALLVWSFSTYLSTGFSKINATSAAADGFTLWQVKLESAALRLGLMGNLCLVFLFFPVTRTSSLLPLIGLTSESSVKYHIWVGHIAMVFLTAHGVCYIVLWAVTHEISEMAKWANTGISNVAGEIALLTGLIMWATTFPRIRRKMFEVFFYTHQLYAVFLLFFLLHVGMRLFALVLPGVYLFLVDRYLRFLQSRRKVRLVSARLLPNEAVELNFSKNPGLSYNPLSTMFINVRDVSSLQWHPYTLTSNSNLEPEKLSMVIKKEGSWTQKLYQKLSSNSSPEHLNISVEGPYGPPSVNFLRHDSLVLVSGGSGITSFISIIRELIHRSAKLGSPTPDVLLICAFKTSADLTMLDLLLPISGNISDLSRLQLKVEAFVTRETEPCGNANKHIRTIWFKPLPSDLPIASVLGPNSWLWLGAIISSSFVAYLLLLGILMRYYIYPIDHNTNHIYSDSSEAMLNLLFISVCIVGAASVAVIWTKRAGGMEAKQVNVSGAATPTTSPSSWIHNADDRELESVPHESLLKAVNVNYGSRPDLKRMLLESKDPDTGVMASGPRGLRQEVARICTSGLANNLHFESISFTW